MMTPETPEAK